MVVKQLMAGSPVPILDADRLEVDTGVVSALTGLGVEDLPSGLAHLMPDADEKDSGRSDSFHLSLLSFYLQTGQVLVGRHLVVILVGYGSCVLAVHSWSNLGYGFWLLAVQLRSTGLALTSNFRQLLPPYWAGTGGVAPGGHLGWLRVLCAGRALMVKSWLRVLGAGSTVVVNRVGVNQ